MLSKIKFTLFLILAVGIFFGPVFVFAKECYVDRSKSDGDGSKKHPYQTIEKALKKKCEKIKIAKGSYDKDIIIPSGVEIQGVGEKTVIKGLITISNKVNVKNLYIKGKGVVVSEGASVKISKVKISNASIGIKTEGDGKLTLTNSTIVHNGKGLYLRHDTKINLENNKIINNRGEGVDIRTNVDGVIQDNIIDSNKEGGIEAVIGRSDLIISNNSLKHNKASGIALQFYREHNELGNVKISGNTLVGNGNYAIDCKNPSGGHVKDGYWSKSVTFSYNKISSNGKGELSGLCQFKNDEIDRAQKTTEEIAKNKEAEKNKNKGITAEEKEKQKQQKKEIEVRRLMEQQKRVDLQLKDAIEQKIPEYEKQCQYSNSEVDLFKKRPGWKIFFIGPDEMVIIKGDERKKKCQKTVEELQQKIEKIQTAKIKQEIRQNSFNKLKQQQKNINQRIENYENKFGIVKWLKEILYHFQLTATHQRS
jgi:parallel beta-helix repeat protein